jgi:hypothetical protein
VTIDDKSEEELNKMTEVVTNISNQTQEPSEAINIYLTKIANLQCRSSVNKKIIL